MGFVTTINDYTAQKDTEKQTDNDTQEDNNEEIKSYSPQQTELLNQINKEKKLPF